MSHELQDAISLEMACRVAARLGAAPELMQIARANLARWSERNADAPGRLRCYAEWQDLLTRPLEEILVILCAETENGQRLRQNSPFVGILTPAEVWSLKSELRRRYAAHPA